MKLNCRCISAWRKWRTICSAQISDLTVFELITLRSLFWFMTKPAEENKCLPRIVHDARIVTYAEVPRFICFFSFFFLSCFAQRHIALYSIYLNTYTKDREKKNGNSVKNAFMPLDRKDTLWARCGVDTLTTIKMNGLYEVARNEEFGTNCTFLGTMISFFWNISPPLRNKSRQLQQRSNYNILFSSES